MKVKFMLLFVGAALVACDARYSEHKMGPTPVVDAAYQDQWLNYLDRRIKSSPRQDESYYRKALILASANDVENALPFARKATELEPENGLYRYFLAKLLYQVKDADAGLKEARMAESLGVEWPDLFVTLGALYLSKGQLDKSQEYLEKGLSKDPLSRDGYLQRGLLRMAKQDTAAAENDILRSLELGETPEGFNALIEISVYHKDYTKAFERLDKSLATDPQNADLLLRKADLLYATGRPEACKEVLFQLIRLDSMQIGYYNRLSTVYLDGYRYDSAIYYQNKTLQIDNKNKDALLTLARIYDRRGFYSSARDYFGQALELDTADAAVRDEIIKLNNKIAYIQRLKAERERNASLEMVQPKTITKPEL